MTRSTIDFGIDLGTTNSEIAVFTSGRTEIIKDSENFEATPSAVWYDARGRKYVGLRAKDQHFRDPLNAKIAFKRQMGKDEPLNFPHLGRGLLPEELSADVLMHLKANVKQWLGEELTAAVITVPAHFNAAQVEATKRAARLAGLEVSPFVQEPVAAATAYGFDKSGDADSIRWLVYDLGGGTFDSALVRRRDGMIRVENHGGDRLLGGSDIDTAVLDQLLIPAVRKLRGFEDFQRGHPRWIIEMANLRIEAEKAKIRLSRVATTSIEIPELSRDSPVPFEFELRRVDLEGIVEPVVVKSIHVCRQVLAEARLGAQDVEKLVLVGGPTLMPYLRERLADARQGLGIPLEFGVDPFTVVARGAAIFAASQPLAPSAPRRAGEYRITLDYKAIGPDADPLVSGQVAGEPGADLSRHTIEFVNAAAVPPWRSGAVALSADGRFIANLLAEPGRENRFDIELADPRGTRQATVPAHFPYTVGGGIGPQMLIQDIGIGLNDNTVVPLFRKGTPLPARSRVPLVTAVLAKRGSDEDAILVPVVEGGERRANRNEIVGTLRIPAKPFVLDLPPGSDIEVTVSVDESRTFTTLAYIPLLDHEVQIRLVGHTQRAEADVLEQQVAEEKQRLAQVREKVAACGDERVRERLADVDKEQIERQVDAALQAARIDQDAGDTCAARLHDLQVALDRIEEALHWPAEVAQAEERIEMATRTIQQHGTADEKAALVRLVQDMRQAIDAGDAGLLNSRADSLNAFAYRIWTRTDEFLTASLAWLEEERNNMTNTVLADSLLADGHRALQANDRDGMRRAIEGLRALLPRGPREIGPFARHSTVLARAG